MWALIFAGAGAAASTFSAFDSAVVLRAIRAKLDVVIAYLEKLETAIARLEQQNQAILKKLDNLPEVVRLIVADALLEVKYSDIHAIKLNITTLNRDFAYRIDTRGWELLSASITYVFRNEFRPSHVFRMIEMCELALAVTRNQAHPFIQKLIDERTALFTKLVDTIANKISSDLDKLNIDLNQKEFVVVSNLTNQLKDVDNLTYTLTADRTVTENYSEQRCRTIRDHCSTPYQECTTINRQRQVPDLVFHQARAEHAAKIDAQKNSISAEITTLHWLNALLLPLKAYSATISKNPSKSSDTILFYPATNVKLLDDNPPLLSGELLDTFNDYFEDIPKVIQSEYIAQNLEPNGFFFRPPNICI